MEPTEVPPQAEPTPSRTLTDACHAPCHRSRNPGHERVVTGTNPRRLGLSPTIVAGSARTWPARRAPPALSESAPGSGETTSDSTGDLRRSAPHPCTSFFSALHGMPLAASPVTSHRSRFHTQRSAVPPAPTTTRHVQQRRQVDGAPRRHRTNCVKRWTLHSIERSSGDVAVPRRPPIPSLFLASARSFTSGCRRAHYLAATSTAAAVSVYRTMPKGARGAVPAARRRPARSEEPL